MDCLKVPIWIVDFEEFQIRTRQSYLFALSAIDIYPNESPNHPLMVCEGESGVQEMAAWEISIGHHRNPKWNRYIAHCCNALPPPKNLVDPTVRGSDYK
ncbi:hypothetical protein CEXT_177381 [Caerostris extrusa]|uniref:Uncharacterized protein n=1 Tax=Caerostris extrusa TaxID=172846 RepID=A0AAV4PE97_CAEEX|nr:hypothetical protein CEXT_177381 [Caerostris extrusa]